jgi:hypothetical protein
VSIKGTCYCPNLFIQRPRRVKDASPEETN